MTLEEITSAISNNISHGLRGVGNFTYPLEQIKDEVKLERNLLLKEYSLKGILPSKDLQQKINCIPVDCEDLAKCCDDLGVMPMAHFEIPKLSTVYGSDAIGYIGPVDFYKDYPVYFDKSFRFAKYKRFGAKSPYVYIDLTTNKNDKIDGFIFNSTMLKFISVELIPDDPEDLKEFSCCADLPFDPTNFMTAQIISRVTEKYVRYYKQMSDPILPNTQTSIV